MAEVDNTKAKMIKIEFKGRKLTEYEKKLKTQEVYVQLGEWADKFDILDMKFQVNQKFKISPKDEIEFLVFVIENEEQEALVEAYRKSRNRASS